jgi:hypothetical protein
MRLIFFIIGALITHFVNANTLEKSVLYFCDYANGIYSYELDSNKLKLLYESDVNHYVMSITQTNIGDIAFSECRMVGGCELKLLDMNNLSIKAIGKGSFIGINNKNLLFTTIEEKYHGHVLRLSKNKETFELDNNTFIHGPVEPSRIISTPKGVYYTNKLLGIDIISSLFYYDYTNQENTYIGDELVPMFYSQDEAGLVMYSLTEGNYKIVRMQGNNQAPNIASYTDIGIVDALVVKDDNNFYYDRYATKWLVFERTNIYKRNIISGKEELLIENKQLISGFLSNYN